MDDKNERKFPKGISFDKLSTLAAEGSCVVIVHPTIATIDPKISYLVRGLQVVILKAITRRDVRLE